MDNNTVLSELHKYGRELMRAAVLLATAKTLSDAYTAEAVAEDLVERRSELFDQVPSEDLGFVENRRSMAKTSEVLAQGDGILYAFTARAAYKDNAEVQALVCSGCQQFLNRDGACQDMVDTATHNQS
jgi:ATP-dependent protease HslVU (ClpYQ) peptidase subunit